MSFPPPPALPSLVDRPPGRPSEPELTAAAEHEPHLELRLIVTDSEVIEALAAVRDVEERGRFALAALRLGVLALRQARGDVDATRVRREGERIVEQIETLLQRSSHALTTTLASALREYLDPQGGHLQQRLTALLADDGDLSRRLRAEVAGQDSALGRTLEGLIGPESPLLRQLDPEHADGLTVRIQRLTAEALTEQREKVLAQFSLDDQGSALSRLVAQISDRQGHLRRELAENLEQVARQFSLDDEGSALSRLLRQVDQAARGMSEQLSLDHEQSGLSRLRRELAGVLDDLSRRQQEFHHSVLAQLHALAGRREAEARGVAHGLAFEDALAGLVEARATAGDDLFERVGTRPGRLGKSKVGDMIVTFGPDRRGAGARVVIEAKEDASTTDASAFAELAEARKNREADFGIFVLSRRIEGDRPAFRRLGDDVLVVWDAEDPATDVNIEVALSCARALVVRRAAASDRPEIDLAAIEDALTGLEQRCDQLQQIETSSETIRKSADRVSRVTVEVRQGLTAELARLRSQTDRVAEALRTADPEREA